MNGAWPRPSGSAAMLASSGPLLPVAGNAAAGTVDYVTETLFELPAPPVDAKIAIGPRQVVDTGSGGRWGTATAVFDPTRTFRYHLSRVWDPDRPRANFLMLNPSTADAFKLDPTVTRCANFALAWGCGSVAVTNCFGLRSTDPDGLRQVADPIGPDNDAAIVQAALAADVVVAAWGVHARYRGREAHVRALLAAAGVELRVLRLTKHGYPGHPLYIPADTAPLPWSA